MTTLHKNAQIVQELLKEKGYDNEVKELPDSTRTAQEAADALGCDVEQIAKSIVFKLREADQALLVIASGSNRIHEKRVGKIIGDALGKADATFVREATGYPIGGVSPVVQNPNVRVLIDEDILQYDSIWGAAGHPKAVFNMTPDELVSLTGGEVVSVT